MDRREFVRMVGGVGALAVLGGCVGGSKSAQALSTGKYDDGVTIGNNKAASILNIKDTSVKQYVQPSIPTQSQAQLCMVPRNYWGAHSPIRSRLNPMTSINQLTIHHEGTPKANWDSSPSLVARDLRKIQAEHLKRMQAGDIGYHYIIDCCGRIWEGRDLSFQGAHTRGHNSGNIGIMVLGNFDIQKPNAAQLGSLSMLTANIANHYRIPAKRVNGHCDLVATRCPGTYMRGKIDQIKKDLA